MTEALVALLVSPKWILQKIQINVILKVHINIVLIVYTPVLFLFDEGLSCILFQYEYTHLNEFIVCVDSFREMTVFCNSSMNLPPLSTGAKKMFTELRFEIKLK